MGNVKDELLRERYFKDKFDLIKTLFLVKNGSKMPFKALQEGVFEVLERIYIDGFDDGVSDERKRSKIED